MGLLDGYPRLYSPIGLMMDAVVTLRPLAIADAAAMVGVLGDAELYAFTGGAPPIEEELRERYARQTRGTSPDGRQQWMNWIVVADEETPVGYVQATRPVGAPTAEIAWVIGVPWQGRGHATRAVTLALEELSSRGVETVTADIHPDNRASAGVARRIGMTPTDQVVDGETRWTGRCRRSA